MVYYLWLDNKNKNNIIFHFKKIYLFYSKLSNYPVNKYNIKK